jgi:hypothetical protein
VARGLVIHLSRSEVDYWMLGSPIQVERIGLTPVALAVGMFLLVPAYACLQPRPRSNGFSISSFGRNGNASLHPTLSDELWDLSALPARPTARLAQRLAYRPRMIYRSSGWRTQPAKGFAGAASELDHRSAAAGALNSSCLSHIYGHRAVPCEMAVGGQLQTVGSTPDDKARFPYFRFRARARSSQSASEAVCAKLQLSVGSEDRVTELVGEKIN